MASQDFAQLRERLRTVDDPVDFLASLFLYSPVGFAIWKPDGHVLLTNPAFLELMGSEPPPEYNVLEDDIAAKTGLLDLVQRAFAGETVQTPTTWYDPRELSQVNVAEGNRVAITMALFPLLDQTGAVQYVAATYKDETAALQAQELLEAESEHLRQLVAQMQQDAAEHRRIEQAVLESEQRFRALIQNSADVVMLLGENSLIQYVSPSVTRVLGYVPEEMVGRSTPEFVRPEELDSLRRHFSELGTHPGISITVEHIIHHRDGSPRVLEVTATNLRHDLSVGAVVVNYHDVTERRQAEAALESSERRFRTLIENSADMLTMFDHKRDLFYASPAVEKISGYTLDELRDRPADVFTHPDDVAVVQAIFAQALQNPDQPIPIMVRQRVKSGEWIRLEGTLTNWLHDADVAAIVCNFRDVTERWKAQEAILELNAALEDRVQERTAALEAANKELESFAYSVSHDLRAPLRSIQGFSQILLEEYADQLDARAQNYLTRVKDGGEWMSHLIDDLLKLSRLSRGPLNRMKVNLSVMTEQLAENLRVRYPERAVELVIEPEVSVKADPNLIRVVLENLVENAWKYTSRHDHARIEFGSVEQEGQRAFFVRDDGAGFDMAYVDKLFGVFQRLHSQTEFEGNGVGLATVQRIIVRHGGRVWAEAAVEQGATFYFTLP